MLRSYPKALLALFLTFIILGLATGMGSAEVSIGHERVMADPPAGWVHRPLLEFFTGLSCPSCMGSGPDADSPEKAVHDKYIEARGDESVPHTTVVFHELNGGGVDALNNQEATDRMRFYQPALSGTPDVEIDGGYIELGGFSTSTRSIDESNLNWALETASDRHNDAPLRPIERATWSFPYIVLEVDQVYQDGQFAVVGKVTYDGNAKIMPTLQELQGSLYVFMVEDNVPAYSMVYDQFVINDAVFRGYAVEDEGFTLRNGNSYEFSASWPVPEIDPKEGVPIKPQDVYAVAAVFDELDTDSAPSATDGNMKANSPRCLQSATSDSTAYDRENIPPRITDASFADDTVTVVFDDEGGIASAAIFYNVEAPNATIWHSLQLELQGEELCDDAGVCYAYFDPVGTVKLEHEGGPLYLQVLANDDQMAQGRSEIFSVGDSSGDVKDSSSMNMVSSGPLAILVIGIIVILIAVLLFLASRKGKTSVSKFFGSKATLAVLILIGLIMAFVGGSGLLTEEKTTVPDFSFTDTNGTLQTPGNYEDKVLVIDIMFTTCDVCNKEMPDVVEVYEDAKERWNDDVQFLSVSVDKDDTKSMMDAFQEKYGAEWPIGQDSSFIEKFDAIEVPKMVIVAPNGDIAYQHTGYIDKGDVLNAIEDAKMGTYKVSPIAQRSGIIVISLSAALFGVLTFFSPCSFPMLPGYFSYYISSETKNKKKKVNPIKGGTFAALGIIVFFLLIAILVAILGAFVKSFLRYLMPTVGFILLGIGILTLIGKDQFLERGIEAIKYPFTLLITKIRGERQTSGTSTGGLFAYGFGYGAAASSCMAPAFIGVILLGASTPLGWLGATIVFIIYAVAIAAMMIVFSYLAASGAKGLEKFISSTDIVKKISGLLLVFAGAFVVWYSIWGYKVLGGFLSF
jgi:cytochrome c-type biogenesis protein